MNYKPIQVYAGIVTYNPDISLLKSNIDNILPQVKEIVVFDNGSNNVVEIKKLLESYERYYFLGEEENKGIAFALNKLCRWGIIHKFDWIITLDQDSIAPAGLVEKLSYYANTNVAMVAPNIVYKGNEEYALHPETKFEEVQWVITSASLTNLELWDKLGGFDEWLFIDGVDYDYGVRANTLGYKVIRCYETELLHELGKLECVNILGKVLYITNHSPFRKYYMTRNAIYLRKKLHEGKPVRTIVKYIVKVIMFEDNKTEKIKSIIRGVLDGLNKIRERCS